MASPHDRDELAGLDTGTLLARVRDRGNLPRHVAIIMDGNGRWAKKRFLPRVAGHRAGRHSVRRSVETCGELGVEVLTLYTFSQENFNRPEAEVKALWQFLQETLGSERDELDRRNVRLTASGALDRLPDRARAGLQEAIYALAGNDGLILNHTSEHFRNLNSRIAHCDAFGEYGYLEARYSDKNWIRSEREGFDGGYKGGEQGNLYQWGADQNIDIFHKAIVSGDSSNPTVNPAVNANLACILGRDAAEANTTMTWDEMIAANRSIEPDLSGLKQ